MALQSSPSPVRSLIIILTSVPGCGKGKVIEFLKTKVDVSVINFGDFMLAAARRLGLAEDRDELRTKISIDQSQSMQRKVARLISKKIWELGGDVIIETHCAVRSAAGYFPGLPYEVIRALKPSAIVVREADPMKIIERRNRDRKTGVRVKRDDEDEESIRLHQELNRAFAAAYSAISGATLRIIIDRDHEDYPFQNAEIVADAIAEILRFR